MESDTERDYLRRLPPEYYRGQAYVHWSMTIEDRKTGWLVPIFYYKFREILTPHHVSLRPLLSHLLLHAGSHAFALGRNLRRYRSNVGISLFSQAAKPRLEETWSPPSEARYDRVLRDEEREHSAFESVVE